MLRGHAFATMIAFDMQASPPSRRTPHPALRRGQLLHLLAPWFDACTSSHRFRFLSLDHALYRASHVAHNVLSSPPTSHSHLSGTRQLFGYAEIEDEERWAAIAQTEVLLLRATASVSRARRRRLMGAE
jgi:hypothetical protein